MKKAFLFFSISALTLLAYQGDRPSKYSYIVDIPVVNKSRSYEFKVSLDGSRDVGDMQFLGFKNRNETVPMVINHDDQGNERIKLVAIAYGYDKDSKSKKKIATQIFYYKAPKGTFDKVTEIDIDYNKVLSLNERGTFKVTFKPNKLPIE